MKPNPIAVSKPLPAVPPVTNTASSSKTRGSNVRAVMQTDGNFVLYQASKVLGSTRTCCRLGVRALMQNDGNFVLYHNGTPIWSTGTGGH